MLPATRYDVSSTTQTNMAEPTPSQDPSAFARGIRSARLHLTRWNRRRLLSRLLLVGIIATVGSDPARSDSTDQPSAVDTLPARIFHAAIYDPPRDRMVVFGGADPAGNFVDEVWTLSLGDPAWSRLEPAGTPPTVVGTASYDPVRDRMVFYCGDSAAVWFLSLDAPAWSQETISGPSPGPRSQCQTLYDPIRDRMILFGGFDVDGWTNDTWALPLSGTLEWSELSPSGDLPVKRYFPSVVYDSGHDRMLLFGGISFDGHFLNDVWALPLDGASAWIQLSPVGTSPPPRYGHTAVFDPVRDRMLVFGGLEPLNQTNTKVNDVWSLSLSATPSWNRLTPSGSLPGARWLHTAVFAPVRDRMLVFGGSGREGYFDDTWVLYSSGFPSCVEEPVWGPLFRPGIVVPNNAQHYTVTVGDTVDAALCIGNSGTIDLAVEGIRLPSPEFRLSRPAPFIVPPYGAVEETLSCVAQGPGVITDTVFIDNGDDSADPKRIPVYIDVLTLEFRSHLLTSTPVVPLGIPLVDLLTPAPQVHVERGDLFYRTAGTNAPFDSVAFTASDEDFIAVIPGAAVSEAGLEYYVRVENSGFFATDPPDAPASLFHQAVQPPRTVVAAPLPTLGSGYVEGRDIDVVVTLPTGAGFTSGTLHYRRGGEREYQSKALALSEFLHAPVARIPAAAVNARGLEYWVEIQTASQSLTFPENDAATSPAMIRTTVQNLDEPNSHRGERYRLVTIPLDLGIDFAGSLDALLAHQPEFGSYDPMRWRAFRYDPGLAANVEFSASQAPSFRPEPARAFWLISRADHRIRQLGGYSTPTQGLHGDEYPVYLEPGWNQFGNPFDFPVAWDSVAAHTPGPLGSPVSFDGGDYADTPPPALQPFEGYFIYSATQDTLWIPAVEASLPTASQVKRQIPIGSGEAWRIRLRASGTESVDGANVLGVDPLAYDGYDPLDQPKPPRAPGSWVQLAFGHPDWRGPGTYRHDIRSSSAEGHAWDFEVRSARMGETITLEPVLESTLPENVTALLIDREQGTAVSALLPCTVLSSGPERSYRMTLLAGSADFVHRTGDALIEIPQRLALDQNAPNPFHDTTLMRFGLPRAERVTLEIYNVQGQRVSTLLHDALLPAGFHTALWNARTADLAAPSGVYFLRLISEDGVLTKRIVRVE